MSAAKHPHEQFLEDMEKEFAPILNDSKQGIYFYLDDPHWTCNERMASMLGYSSPKEVVALSANAPLLDAIVSPESKNVLIDAYMRAVNDKVASVVPITWKKKGGAIVKSHTIIAPVSFKGTILAIHFITPD